MDLIWRAQPKCCAFTACAVDLRLDSKTNAEVLTNSSKLKKKHESESFVFVHLLWGTNRSSRGSQGWNLRHRKKQIEGKFQTRFSSRLKYFDLLSRHNQLNQSHSISFLFHQYSGLSTLLFLSKQNRERINDLNYLLVKWRTGKAVWSRFHKFQSVFLQIQSAQKLFVSPLPSPLQLQSRVSSWRAKGRRTEWLERRAFRAATKLSDKPTSRNWARDHRPELFQK